MITTARPTEREIYHDLWANHALYREVSPGEQSAQTFLELAKPKPGSTILDLGCGTGRGGLMLAILGGLNVTLIDFADNCLDDDIRPMLETQAHTLRFVEADLTKPLGIAAPFGFCTDVLEHIPTENVLTVLDTCLHAAEKCFFQISTVPDVMGQLIGHSLHLTVQSFDWWKAQFEALGCSIYWSYDLGNACQFYVSAWTTGQNIVDIGILNIEEQQAIANVQHNTNQPWQQVVPHETNDIEVMIIGGGPSTVDYLDEIREARANGTKLITLNGAYNWVLEQGLIPSAQIIVDAREFNNRFVHPVVDDCKYLIASQCHPSVFEGLPYDRTYIWHTSTEMIHDVLNTSYETWYGIPGGSTVLLRAIPLLRVLGFQKFVLYGCDSCLSNNQHHLYSQPENDKDVIIPVTVGGRIFYCHPWMASQCTEMLSLIRAMGDLFKLDIKGDGLLAWVLQHGYDLALEDQKDKTQQTKRLKREAILTC